MSSYKNGLTYGSGLFIDEKYPGEKHVHGYSFLGPGSRLDIRLDQDLNPKKGELPINQLDNIALSHDKKYKLIKDQYNIDHDKTKAISAVHKADDEFINAASQSNVQPLGKISAGIIKAKELAEKVGVLNTKTFSGMGNKTVSFVTKNGREIKFSKKHDPTARLKKLAGVGICKPKKETKKRGGIAPLAVGVLSALAGTALSKVWDLVRDKIEGKGFKIDNELYPTDAHKRAFIKHVLH